MLNDYLTDGWSRSLVKPLGLNELLPDGCSAVQSGLFCEMVWEAKSLIAIGL